METAKRQRYVLAWLAWRAEIDRGTVGALRCEIEDNVKESREEVEVDVWLDSPGGDAHVAYKLALILRDIASHVRVVIPDYAKSAATLLALVGDEIYMAPGAELGPLDAQMPEEGSISGAISALSIAHAADAVAEDAVALAGTGGAELLRRTGLSRAETLSAMLEFSARFSEPLVCQLNPTLVHQAKELLRVTARYAERLLGATTPRDKAREIAAHLVESFPTHGFVIDLVEAQKLGLPVKPLAEYDLLEQFRPIHRLTEASGMPIIRFEALDEFLEAANGATDQEPPKESEPSDQTDHGTKSGTENVRRPRRRRSSTGEPNKARVNE